MRSSRLFAPLILVLLIVVTVGAAAAVYLVSHNTVDATNAEVVETTGERLTDAVGGRAYYLSDLADMVGVHDDADVQEFARWAAVRGENESAMVSIQWLRRSPDGKLLPPGDVGPGESGSEPNSILLPPVDPANKDLADAASNPAAASAINTASLRKEVALSAPVQLASGNQGFYLAVPIEAHAYSGDISKIESLSVMVGLIDAQLLVADAMSPPTAAEVLALQHAGGSVQTTPAPESVVVSTGPTVLASVGPGVQNPVEGDVTIQDQIWSMRMTGATVTGFVAALPWFILGIGLGIAVTVGFALLQASRRRDAALLLAHERSTELAHSAAMMERITGSIDECFYTYAIDSKGRVTVRFATPGWTRILAMPPISDVQTPAEWTIPVLPEDADRLHKARTAMKAGGRVDVEFRVSTSDGDVRWLWAREHAIGREDGQLLVDGVISDITARKTVENQLAHRASHDPLTELPNRSLFLEHLAGSLQQSKADGTKVAILFIDIDRFKNVNDSLGHDIGDQLLVGIAQRLTKAARPGDIVARFGGDEFTVLCDQLTSEREAVELAQKFASVIATPFDLDGTEVVANASVGIAIGPGDATAAERLLRDADLAMYRAKDLGSGYALFDDSLGARVTESFRIEHSLRAALETNHLPVHYQPIIEINTGRLVGVEALVRWDRPGETVVPADEFIAVAETTGLIVPIGRHVLTEACAQVREWQNMLEAADPHARPLWLAWNVSVPELSQSDLPGVIEETLRANRLEASSLFVEITERVLIDGLDTSIARLNGLRRVGVKLSIDDFGTGYSSLSYLTRLPIDQIKIDQTFVEYLGRDTQDSVIVSAIIDMAKTLGISVVAEGIETIEQLRVLETLQCESGQGWYFAGALPPSTVTQVIRAGGSRNFSQIIAEDQTL